MLEPEEIENQLIRVATIGCFVSSVVVGVILMITFLLGTYYNR
jgi:hypothetical protein